MSGAGSGGGHVARLNGRTQRRPAAPAARGKQLTGGDVATSVRTRLSVRGDGNAAPHRFRHQGDETSAAAALRGFISFDRIDRLLFNNDSCSTRDAPEETSPNGPNVHVLTARCSASTVRSVCRSRCVRLGSARLGSGITTGPGNCDKDAAGATGSGRAEPGAD